MKAIILGVVAFIAGFAVCWLVPRPVTTAHDWQAVRAYRAYVEDPSNYRPSDQPGLSVTTPPPTPIVSLAALVAAGELEHLDIVLPTVPYGSDSGRYWLRYVGVRDAIVFATGNPSYTAYQPTGEQPLHLNLWFLPEAKQDVQRLIRELERRATTSSDGAAADPPVSPSRQIADPVVPEHTLRDRLVGVWEYEGETALHVKAQSDGTVTIASPQAPPWGSIINHVRWEGDALHYDEYMYFTGPEDFTTITNPHGDHPYSGVRNDTTITFTNDPDRLLLSVFTKHLDEPIRVEYRRARSE